MNFMKLLIIAVLLSSPFAVLAQDVPKTETFEVSIFDIRLPRSAGGTVGFKPCDECDYRRIRVTPRTEFVVDGKHLKYKQFLNAVETIRQGGDKTVNVVREELTGTVSRIHLRSH